MTDSIPQPPYEDVVTAPYLRHGENPAAVTEPLPVPGYPLNDVPPNATGGNVTQVPNVHEQYGVRLDDAYNRDAELAQQRAINAELLARLERLEKPKTTPAPVTLVGGGEPVTHHLHLVDGRVITDHGGIGTHYSETLPDGSTKVTRVHAFYPAEEPDPVARIA